MAVRVFKHSGDLGDIIYAMPVMRELGGGHLRLTKSRNVREAMNENKASSIFPLAMNQNYIQSCRFGVETGAIVTHDFDSFRQFIPAYGPRPTLVAAQFKLFDLEPNYHPWLKVIPIEKSRVVFARSQRYHNPGFNWKKIYAKYRDQAIFIGTKAEHSEFCEDVGFIYRAMTPTLNTLAGIIAGAKLFVGNQSCPLAIAIGLGQNIIMEECPYAQDCHIERDNIQFSIPSQLPSVD